jgi:hypothetical protein
MTTVTLRSRPGAPERFVACRLLPAPLAIVLAGIAFTGCEAPDTSAQATGAVYDRETEIFEVISRVDFGAVAGAYGSLAEAPHQVRIESSEKDDGGRLIASETLLLQVGVDDTEVVPVATEGEMSSGFMAFAASNDSLPDLSPGVAGLWTPKEPAFASPRNRDYYRYAVAADTLVSGEPCRSYTVTALEGVAADRMPIRRARVYVSEVDTTILGIRIWRQDDALFYRERSSLEMTLHRNAERRLLPLRRSIEVVVEAPLRSPHYFATTQDYLVEGAPVPDGR